MIARSDQCRVPRDLGSIAARLLSVGRRLLIWGPAGVGKSTLAVRLWASLEADGRACWGIAADPGSPGFGVAGAVSLGSWGGEGWQCRHIVPLCTLDAARFRLPLVQALRRLAGRLPDGATVLIDAPGVVRGTAATELLLGIVEAVGAHAVLAILPAAGAEANAAHAVLGNLCVDVFVASPSRLARRRSKRQRARARTAEWNRWLAAADDHDIVLSGRRLSGVPPRLPEHWPGHQVALLNGAGEAMAFGEAVGAHEGGLRCRLVGLGGPRADWSTVGARDAARGPDGLLTTVRMAAKAAASARVPPDLVPRSEGRAEVAAFAHLGTVSASLVNGIFGDPLLHIRLRQERRSLLFDLGDSARLPAKIAHQVSDIFITHAHMDHIGGFLWFLRSRIGQTGTCRLYGPVGLAGHVASFVDGICWDRIGHQGPRFEITEVHGQTLRRFRLQVGGDVRDELGEIPLAADETLIAEPGFRVRTVPLDHGIPVLAFSLETPPTLHVRKDRLKRAGVPEGPWLGELKRRLAGGPGGRDMLLPDGRRASVASLGDELIAREPPRRLIYATDLADTPVNRSRLRAFAAGGDVLYCEASFLEEDAAQAQRTGHLTARACGEIAALAGVRRLVPFHFSHRYEEAPERVYQEVGTAFRGELVQAQAVREPE
jgi:ribonuclease Z